MVQSKVVAKTESALVGDLVQADALREQAQTPHVPILELGTFSKTSKHYGTLNAAEGTACTFQDVQLNDGWLASKTAPHAGSETPPGSKRRTATVSLEARDATDCLNNCAQFCSEVRDVLDERLNNAETEAAVVLSGCLDLTHLLKILQDKKS